MRAFAGVCCAALLLACSGGAREAREPQKPGHDGAMASVDEAVAMLVDMGSMVMSARADCDLMATRVGGWLDVHGAKLKALNEELERVKSAETEERYRQRLSEHVDVVVGLDAAVQGCAEHAGFLQAWKRLDS